MNLIEKDMLFCPKTTEYTFLSEVYWTCPKQTVFLPKKFYVKGKESRLYRALGHSSMKL